MAKRRWTILVVPDGSGTSRELQLSARALRTLTGFGVLFAAAILGLTVTAVSKGVALSRLDRLEKRNQYLAIELDRMTDIASVLQDTITAITTRDRRVRLFAGLEPSDPEVLEGGIGGPLTPPTAAESLLAETALGQRALQSRFDLEALKRRALMLAASYQQAVDTMATVVDLLRRTPSISPTDGFLTSRFSQSRMHPIYHEERPHWGVDIVAPRGAPIVATAAGRVVDVGNKTGYGLTVTIDHGNGLRTRYAHASKLLVRTGQRVDRGQTIAEVGRTGTATNNHVHYEVLLNGRPVNPSTYNFGARIVD